MQLTAQRSSTALPILGMELRPCRRSRPPTASELPRPSRARSSSSSRLRVIVPAGARPATESLFIVNPFGGTQTLDEVVLDPPRTQKRVSRLLALGGAGARAGLELPLGGAGARLVTA